MAVLPPIFQAVTMITYLFFHWKGALTHNSISMKIFVNKNLVQTVQQWSLMYYEDGSDVILSKELPIVNTLEPVGVVLDNLKPYTLYKYFFFYEPISNFKADNIESKYEIFKFKTLQTPYVKQDLSLVFSSCAKTGSEDPVFSDIMTLFPDSQFFIQMGDIFYSDITENIEILFHESYFRLFQSKKQKAFYQYFTTIYIWDDHDFGDNNAGQSCPAREAATNAYLKNVPYYPLRQVPEDLESQLKFPSNVEGVYQYVIVGQTLIIIMDLRSHFVLSQRAMDEHQLKWVLNLLTWCENNSKLENLVVVSSIPWLGQDLVEFKEQRKLIGEGIAKVMKVKSNVLLISGDSHMVAFDNGYNNDAGGFPHCVSSPLDKTPSCKGGKYTFGPFSGNSQYSTLDIVYNEKLKRDCFIVQGWRRQELLYRYNSCNEDDVNLKLSNQCFTSIAQIFLVSLLPVIAVIAALVCIWRNSIKFTNMLSKSSRPYQEVPQNQQQNAYNQNIDGYSGSSIKNFIPFSSFQGKSTQKLNVEGEAIYGQIIKSPSYPYQNQPVSIFAPSDMKNVEYKEENQ